MAITIIVTNAGRAALVNAANNGTNAVTITQLGVTAAVFVPNAAQVALPGEIKRIASVAGLVVADDQIHLTASDVTPDAYTMRGFGLYLADGTLFAIYGQAGEILNKTSESMMLLAIDVAFADIDAEMIVFGDTNFVLPPATTEILGLVELATTAEGQTGSDATRVLTPLVGKQSVLGWMLSQDGSGSGLDADLLDGFHATAFSQAGHTHDRAGLTGFGTMAAQNANTVDIDGGAIDGTPIGAATAAAGRFTSVLATGGSSGFGALTPKGRVQISAGVSADTPVAGAIGNGVPLYLTNSDPGYGLAFGIAGTGSTWLQSQRADGNGALYNILLNPIGGNVGINQIAPVARLHVKSAAEIVRIETTVARGGGQCYFAFADPIGPKGYVGYANADDGIDIHNNMAGPIRLVTSGIERMRIAGDGKVSFNGAGPNYQFNLAAPNPPRGIIADIGNNAGAGLNGAMISFTQNGINNWCIGQVPGVDAFGIYRGRNSATDGQELARFNLQGHFISNYAIGVGVSPAVALHAKAAGEVLRLETTTARGGGNNFLSFHDPAGRKAYFGYGAANDGLYVINEMNGPVYFGTNGAARLVLDETGNLVPTTDNAQILGWPTARLAAGHFAQFVRIGGNDAWHAGNDGSGSGLDADLLDGQHGAYYLPAASYTAGDVISKLLGVDGAGSGLDADLLDGLHASAFAKISDFVYSLGSSGYAILPGGFMIVWGNYSVSANGTTNAIFPLGFSNACLFADCTGGRLASGAQDNNPFVTGPLLAGSAPIYSSSSSAVSGKFFAIGY